MDKINQVWPQWKTVELIGEGTYGKVYKVKREEMGNISFAAVKVLQIPQQLSEIRELQSSGMDAPSIHAFYEGMIKNFMDEIKIMESLKTANGVVSVEDYQVIARQDSIGWDIYIRMELLTALSVYMEREPLQVQDIVRLGIEMTEALKSCEKKHIIHRDIKIDNVFVNQFGSFKLGDFGISRQMEKTMSAMSQKGTNMYMAPEVFRGESYNQTVDIYSLGIMLYRLLNRNRFPFMPPYPQPIRYDDNERVMQRRLSGEKLPPIEGIDRELSDIVCRACEYRSEERYQHPQEMEYALRQYFYKKQFSGEHSQQDMPRMDTDEKKEDAFDTEGITTEEESMFSTQSVEGGYADEKTSAAFERSTGQTGEKEVYRTTEEVKANESAEGKKVDETAEKNEEKAEHSAAMPSASKKEKASYLHSSAVCSRPVGEKAEESLAKPQEVQVSGIKAGNKAKKIIIGAVIVLLICVVGGIGYKIYSDKKAEKNYQAYIDNLEQARELMSSSARNSESLCRLRLKVWGNAIFEEEDNETDEYTRTYEDGIYVWNDFNDALSNFHDDPLTKTKVEAIQSNQSSVEELIKQLQNPPEELDTCYDALLDLHEAYKTLSDLATDADGGYNYYDFARNTNDAAADFTAANERLDNQIPKEN